METHTILAIAAAPLVADLIRRYETYKYPFDGSFFRGLFLFVKKLIRSRGDTDASGSDVGGESHSSSPRIFIPKKKPGSLTIDSTSENATSEKTTKS